MEPVYKVSKFRDWYIRQFFRHSEYSTFTFFFFFPPIH